MSAKGCPKTRHQHTLQWYADLFGLPYRTVHAFHKRGWKLDNYAEVLQGIYAQRAGKRPPVDKLERLVFGERAPAHAERRNQPRPAPPPKKRVNGNGAHDEDVMSPLKRQITFVEEEIERAKEEYAAEVRPLDRSNRLKDITTLIGTLEKLTKGIPAAELEVKAVVRRSEVDSAWNRLLKEVRSQLDALPRRIALNPMFKRVDPVAVEKLLVEERDQVYKILQNGGWL